MYVHVLDLTSKSDTRPKLQELKVVPHEIKGWAGNKVNRRKVKSAFARILIEGKR